MEKRSGKIENFLRMSDEDFHFLLNLIAPMISKQDTVMRKAISAKERFLVTLRFLATGESYEDLQYLSRISPQSLSTIIIEVCQALIKVLAPQMQVRKNLYNTVHSVSYVCTGCDMSDMNGLSYNICIFGVFSDFGLLKHD